MRIGYNQATSMKHSSLEADVALCAAHGFDGLEMQTDLMDRYMSAHSPDDLRALFADSGIKAFPVNAFVGFNIQSDGNPARLRYLCGCAKATGAGALILVPALRDISLDQTAEAIKGYTATAAEYGVSMALEFLGFAESSVRSLEQAAAIADQIPGLKLVLDCAHIMGGTTGPATILQLRPERIETVHINDLTRKPSEVYSDSDRVWPGDGDLGLSVILKNLKAIGYDGIVSVELFNEEYWEWPADEIFKTAIQKTRAVIEGVAS